MTWPDVMRSLLDAGVPAPRIGEAIMILENGGSVREAEDALHCTTPLVEPPAVSVAELLVAEAARTAAAVKIEAFSG